jgi:4-amino-4-deoxy-L-arabinose transferase-like glycosyltransferase
VRFAAAILPSVTSSDEPARRPASSRGSRRFAVPPALAALLVAVAIIGLAWALLVPPFQAPDESTHFAYAESVATRLAVPGDPRRLPHSTAQSLADAAVRASGLAVFGASMRPDWSDRDFRAYLAHARDHPDFSDGGGPNAQSVNPPLFYLFSDVAYWVSGSDNLFGRLYAMRVWGVSLLLLTVVAGWLLAGEVLRGRRLAQLVCAAVCGLVPMETFIATSVTPDALMVPLWTLALWLGARVTAGDARSRTILALCAVTAAAVLTKATSYALIPAVVLALVFAVRAASREGRRAVWGSVLAAAATTALPVLAWILYTTSHGRSPINTVQPAAAGRAHHFSIPQFLSSVWQFYLPRLPFQSRFASVDRLGVFHIWLEGGWGRFGWTNVNLPGWVYPVLGAVSAALTLGAGAVVATTRAPHRFARLSFFAVALLALLAGLHLTDYRAIIAGQGALLQGRYLLPVIGLFGLAAAVVTTRIPARWRGAACGAALAGLLLLQVLSLATVARAYYT